jgi:hypothetical protein
LSGLLERFCGYLDGEKKLTELDGDEILTEILKYGAKETRSESTSAVREG